MTEPPEPGEAAKGGEEPEPVATGKTFEESFGDVTEFNVMRQVARAHWGYYQSALAREGYAVQRARQAEADCEAKLNAMNERHRKALVLDDDEPFLEGAHRIRRERDQYQDRITALEAALAKAEWALGHYRTLARELATDASALREPPNPSQPQEPAETGERCDRCDHPWSDHIVGHGCTARLDNRSECECGRTSPAPPAAESQPGGFGPTEALRREIVEALRAFTEDIRPGWGNLPDHTTKLADRLERK